MANTKLREFGAARWPCLPVQPLARCLVALVWLFGKSTEHEGAACSASGEAVRLHPLLPLLLLFFFCVPHELKALLREFPLQWCTPGCPLWVFHPVTCQGEARRHDGCTGTGTTAAQ